MSPSQSQVDSVIKVLLALGVDIATYIDIKGERSNAVNSGQSQSGQSVTTVRDTNKEVIVLPASLDVIQVGSSESLTKTEVKKKGAESVEAKTTTYTFDVNERDEIVSGPKFSCDKCNKEFDKENQLESHQTGECSRQHFCKTCNKLFSSSQTYTNHMKLHTKELEYKCEICSIVGRSKLQLLEHYASLHLTRQLKVKKNGYANMNSLISFALILCKKKLPVR